jgi:hypothetical protein
MEAFFQTFPAFKEKFNAPFRRETYKHIIELFVGDWFSFEFHLEMLRKLFGDHEVRYLTPKNKPQCSIFVEQPETFLLDSDLKRVQRMKAKGIKFRSEDDTDAEDEQLDLLHHLASVSYKNTYLI